MLHSSSLAQLYSQQCFTRHQSAQVWVKQSNRTYMLLTAAAHQLISCPSRWTLGNNGYRKQIYSSCHLSVPIERFTRIHSDSPESTAIRQNPNSCQYSFISHIPKLLSVNKVAAQEHDVQPPKVNLRPFGNQHLAIRTSLHYLASRTSLHWLAIRSSLHFLAIRSSLHSLAIKSSLHSLTIRTSLLSIHKMCPRTLWTAFVFNSRGM